MPHGVFDVQVHLMRGAQPVEHVGEVLAQLDHEAGEEAVAVGICSQLTDRDYITSTHRGHGHTLAKGADPVRMMCELFGKASGYVKEVLVQA